MAETETGRARETVALAVSLPESLRDWLKREAMRRNATMSSVVTELI